MYAEKSGTFGVLSLPVTESANASVTIQGTSHPVNDTGVKYIVVEEVLRHMPKRGRKNAQHILAALTRASDVISWTDQGELNSDQSEAHMCMI